jgi:enolase
LEVLEAVCDIQAKAGLRLAIGIDVAATNMYDASTNRYIWAQEGIERSPEEQFEFMCAIADRFPVFFMEDIFHESDFESFSRFTHRYGDRLLVCGDDLLCCDEKRVARAIAMEACNSLIVKPNMAGTLTDAARIVRIAKTAGWTPVISRRSGETEDALISHLAVAWGCPFGKFGLGGIGCAKINEQLRLQEELEGDALSTWAGPKPSQVRRGSDS